MRAELSYSGHKASRCFDPKIVRECSCSCVTWWSVWPLRPVKVGVGESPAAAEAAERVQLHSLICSRFGHFLPAVQQEHPPLWAAASLPFGQVSLCPRHRCRKQGGSLLRYFHCNAGRWELLWKQKLGFYISTNPTGEIILKNKKDSKQSIGNMFEVDMLEVLFSLSNPVAGGGG